jgi:hypothetical protein
VAGPGRPIQLLGTSGRTKRLDIEGTIFIERHFRLYGSGVGFAYAFLLALRLWHGVSGVGPTGKLACIDFYWIWVSGIFSVSSDPSRVYDLVAYSAVPNTLVDPTTPTSSFHFVYPHTVSFHLCSGVYTLIGRLHGVDRCHKAQLSRWPALGSEQTR